MAKKKAVVRKGIFLTRNSKGIVVSIHASNGRKLAVMQGYNNKANAQKGIFALECALQSAYNNVDYTVTDLTKPVKKTSKPKSK